MTRPTAADWLILIAIILFLSVCSYIHHGASEYERGWNAAMAERGLGRVYSEYQGGE